MSHAAARRQLGVPGSDRRSVTSARRWLWGVWIGVGLGLAGQLVDLDWHAQHGSFRTASDVFQAHWLTWLGVALTIGVGIAGARSYAGSRSGFGYIALAAGVNAVAHAWNAFEHIRGAKEPIVPHVLLAVSGVGILVASFYTVHLLFGRDEHAGFFKGK